jgi:hypothetical protein
MTLAEIDAALPWGLHDAALENVVIDWPKAKLTLICRVRVTERADFDRACEIVITGLVFCAIDAPEIDAARGYRSTPPAGLWIDAGEGAANDEALRRLPATPAGCFLHWIFVKNWNRFIHICARKADLGWLEPQPRRMRSGPTKPEPGEPEESPDDPLQDIVGQNLSAVVFVQDYVQLLFDGPQMNIMTPLTVGSGASVTRSEEVAFRNALCAQIAKRVASVSAERGVAVTITFSDDSTISISLKEVDYPGPEAVLVRGDRNRWTVL